MAVLKGINPYSQGNSFYPPAATILFAPLALLPIQVSYILLCIVSALILVWQTKRKAIGWLTFVPVLFIFAAGQIDFLFLALIPFLHRKDKWMAPIAAALFTLKPQLAAFVLPWFLIRWLLRERALLTKSVAISIVLHAAPLLVRPTIYAEWAQTISYGVGHKFGGIGVWKLINYIPLWLIMLITLALIILALISDESTSRVLMMAANPVLGYYDAVLLIGTVPWWVLGPVSLLALALAHLICQTHTPFVLITIAATIYRLRRRQAKCHY